MKKIKILILILLIFIILLLTIVGLLHADSNNKKNILDDNYAENENVALNYNLAKVDSKYEFYDVNNCINNYINTLKSLNKDRYNNGYNSNQMVEEIEETIQIQREKLYNILSKDYTQMSNITVDNIDKKFSKYYKDPMFNIYSMEVLDINGDIAIYVIDGQIVYNRESGNSNITSEDYQFIIRKDSFNLTFEVYPPEYIQTVGGIEKAIESIKKNAENEIKDIKDNRYYSDAYSNEYISKNYFNIYYNNIIKNPEYIYSKMDIEYRNKKFGTLQNFKQYINENKDEISKVQLISYLVQEENEHIEYVCKDQFDNIYVFRQTNIGEYTLTLDTYTLEQPKFNTEYAKASDQKKVMMNIDKFFQMINAKDYTAAYKCLAQSFKNNYFKTEESFKKYIKQNLYTYNNIEYRSFSNEVSGIYGYNLIITDKNNIGYSKDFNIIMKLNSGIDFEMSFEI